MPQLSQRLCFDLTYAFTRYFEEATYLLKCMVFAIFQTKAQFQHFTFAFRKRCEGALYLLTQHLASSRVHRREGIFIGNEICQGTRFLVPYGTIDRHRFLSRAQYAIYFLSRRIQPALQIWRKRFFFRMRT